MMAGKAAEAAGTCRGKGMMGAKLFAVFIRRLWNRPAAFLSTASLAGVLLLIAGAPHAARSQIKYQTDPGASAKKTLPLRDFRPKSMLHLQVHNVLQARFPVIDVHQHVNDAMHVSEEHIPAERLVEMMDRCNIRTIVILTGMWGDKLQNVVDEMVRPYPDRFLVFTQLDWSKIDEPDFGQLMVRQIDDAVRRGARANQRAAASAR
jgi:hypothetical protein